MATVSEVEKKRVIQKLTKLFKPIEEKIKKAIRYVQNNEQEKAKAELKEAFKIAAERALKDDTLAIPPLTAIMELENALKRHGIAPGTYEIVGVDIKEKVLNIKDVNSGRIVQVTLITKKTAKLLNQPGVVFTWTGEYIKDIKKFVYPTGIFKNFIASLLAIVPTSTINLILSHIKALEKHPKIIDTLTIAAYAYFFSILLMVFARVKPVLNPFSRKFWQILKAVLKRTSIPAKILITLILISAVNYALT